MMNNDQLPAFLNGLEPPEPPPELRRRVLMSTEQALARMPIRDLWTRIWGNPFLRLAWVGCVIALLVCHLLISLRFRRPAEAPTAGPLEFEDRMDAVDLGPLRLAARPAIGAQAMYGDDLISSTASQTRPRME